MKVLKKTSPLPLQRERWWRVVLDLFVVSGFICLIGGMFVAFAVMLGKYELVTLVYVLLLGALVRPFISPRWMNTIERLPVIGEATDIYNDLEKYYRKYRPRPFFYYILYPISGIFSFFFSSRQQARRELNAYFGLIQWIVLLLIIEGFASYFRVYQYFELRFALQWFYLELLCIYFLCNFFAVPVATTTLNLHLAQKKARLFYVALLALVVLTGFLYFFAVSASYDNLIPINIIMDRRIAESKDTKDNYATQLQDKTLMFLRHHCPRIAQFNKEHLFDPSNVARAQFVRELNASYQDHLNSISPFGEQDYFFLTITQEYPQFWGIVALPFRDSLFYVFRFNSYSQELQIFSQWDDLSAEQRQQLAARWDNEGFYLPAEKQFARVIVDYLREIIRTRSDQQKNAASELQEKMGSKKDRAKRESKILQEPLFAEEERVAPEKAREDAKNLKESPEKPSFSPRPYWIRYYRSRKQQEEHWKQLFDKIDTLLARSVPGKNRNYLAEFLAVWQPQWRIAGHDNFLQQASEFSQRQSQQYRKVENLLRQLAPVSPDSRKGRRLQRELSSSLQDLVNWVNEVENFTRQLGAFANSFATLWERMPVQRPLFILFCDDLREFDFEKAISAKLLYDHWGKSPELRKTWFSVVVSYVFSLLFLLFELSMPLHIALIFYCRARLGS